MNKTVTFQIIYRFLIALAIVFSMFGYIYSTEPGIEALSLNYPMAIGLLILFVLIVSLAFFFITNKVIDRFYPWNAANTSLRFFFEVVTITILLLLLGFIFFNVYQSYTIVNESSNEGFNQISDGKLKYAILSVVAALILSVIDQGLASYKFYTVRQLTAIKIENEQMELKFQALRNQLSPHFLFNSLNTISSLIYKNTMQAEHYIRNMSKTYKFVSQLEDEKLVPLAKELDLVSAYFQLQSIRFEGSINFIADLPDPIKESYVPPLTLQILFENAIKHNQINNDHHLKIELFFKEPDLLVFQNNLIKKSELIQIENNLVERPDNNSLKIGLENIKSRYSYFANKDVKITVSDKFIVELPLITQRDEKG